MVLLYMVTFTINIPQMLAYILYIYIYIPYMDPMGKGSESFRNVGSDEFPGDPGLRLFRILVNDRLLQP